MYSFSVCLFYSPLFYLLTRVFFPRIELGTVLSVSYNKGNVFIYYFTFIRNCCLYFCIFVFIKFIERRYAVDMNQLLHDIVNVCFLRFTHLYCTIVLDPTLRPCRTLTRVISRCCWRQLLRAHRLAPV